MTAEAGDILLGEIAPRLRSAIPRFVKPVGAEDSEELVQDGIALAARMLHNSEEAGKLAPAASVAYYTIQHLKSGRRSQCASRADVMACGTQLDHKSGVLSVEEQVGYDPELDEPITLGALLACHREDPSMAGARNVDWDQFLGSHDHRYGVIVTGMAEGKSLAESARVAKVSYWQLGQLKEKLADDLREFMGDEAIEDSLRNPSWRGNLVVDRERAACQADRRRR